MFFMLFVRILSICIFFLITEFNRSVLDNFYLSRVTTCKLGRHMWGINEM